MMNGGTVMEVDTGLSRLTLSYFIDIERGREDNTYVRTENAFRFKKMILQFKHMNRNRWNLADLLN